MWLPQQGVGVLTCSIAQPLTCNPSSPAPRPPLPTHARPGNLTITSSDSVPLIAPVGPYSMRMQAWDQGGAGVMCIDIWFRVVSQPSPAEALPATAGGSGGAREAQRQEQQGQGRQQQRWEQQLLDELGARQQAEQRQAARLGGRKWMRPDRPVEWPAGAGL